MICSCDLQLRAMHTPASQGTKAHRELPLAAASLQLDGVLGEVGCWHAPSRSRTCRSAVQAAASSVQPRWQLWCPQETRLPCQTEGLGFVLFCF